MYIHPKFLYTWLLRRSLQLWLWDSHLEKASELQKRKSNKKISKIYTSYTSHYSESVISIVHGNANFFKLANRCRQLTCINKFTYCMYFYTCSNMITYNVIVHRTFALCSLTMSLNPLITKFL